MPRRGRALLDLCKTRRRRQRRRNAACVAGSYREHITLAPAAATAAASVRLPSVTWQQARLGSGPGYWLAS